MAAEEMHASGDGFREQAINDTQAQTSFCYLSQSKKVARSRPAAGRMVAMSQERKTRGRSSSSVARSWLQEAQATLETWMGRSEREARRRKVLDELGSWLLAEWWSSEVWALQHWFISAVSPDAQTMTDGSKPSVLRNGAWHAGCEGSRLAASGRGRRRLKTPGSLETWHSVTMHVWLLEPPGLYGVVAAVKAKARGRCVEAHGERKVRSGGGVPWVFHRGRPALDLVGRGACAGTQGWRGSWFMHPSRRGSGEHETQMSCVLVYPGACLVDFFTTAG